ncbi:hypothetical protein SEA_CHASER_143 [Mycobacterium phage Chaser]|nr:hypothetical protein SEA_CHASER_143 [Mycobacterium phage Chaser]
MFTVNESKRVLQHVYPSLAAFADYQAANQYKDVGDASFYGASSIQEAVDRAKAGVPESGIKALDASRSLTDAAMRQIDAQDVQGTYDVGGSYVDMGRYMTGEPECMVEYVIQAAPVQRPVVTLVSNIAASCGISTAEMAARGRLVVALVKAIESSGRSTELWADFTVAPSWTKPKHHWRASVKIKPASAPLDMGAIMYAYTDASMMRVLGLNAMHHIPDDMKSTYSVGFTYGYPAKGENAVEESYGPDAVYLPSIRMGDNGEAIVLKILRDLGIAA